MKYPNFSDLMVSNDPKLTPLVTETLGEILDKVSTLESREAEINILMHTCLRSLISCVVNRPSLRQKFRSSGSSGNNDVDTKPIENMRSNLANLIALLHEMTPKHYSHYIGKGNEYVFSNHQIALRSISKNLVKATRFKNLVKWQQDFKNLVK